MGIEQVIQLSAINVAFNPHPAGIYERLIRTSYRRKIVGHVFSDRYGLMSQLHGVVKDGTTIAMEGVISTFSKLDPNLPWFNSDTSADASEDDLGELNVPDNLQPNHRQCEFYFDLRTHTFVFSSLSRKGGITARQMLHFLGQVFQHPDVTRAIGSVPSLTIIPDQQSIDDIVDWGRIRTLLIVANRPNPGDYDEDDLREFEESLVEQNAKKLELRLVAEENAYLEPSQNTQTVAAIAADNGYVEARGEDAAGHLEVRSTKEKKPFTERQMFDPDAEAAWDAFRRIAQSIPREIRRRRREHRQPA